MASLTLMSQSRFLHKQPNNLRIFSFPDVSPKNFPNFKSQLLRLPCMASRNIVMSALKAEMPRNRQPEEGKGFIEEMRFVAMKLHTREKAVEGEIQAKAPEEQSIDKWEPSLDGYLKFLVNIKLVYDTVEDIIDKASIPDYGELRNCGLERSEKLAKDLKWFKERGCAVGEPSYPGVAYAEYLKQLSEKNPRALICHVYNLYFANTAGGRIIGKKVATEILENKELEFYKWDGDVSQLLQNVEQR